MAHVAAIQAAKSTQHLIPYCHPVPLDHVHVDLVLLDERIEITVSVKAIYRTGVEMEALTGAAAAALTLYDMLKMSDETMEIVSIRLLEKTGGKSGHTGALAGTFRAAVIVVSDSCDRGESQDHSGAVLRAGLAEHGAEVESLAVVPDERERIRTAVIHACDQLEVDALFLTGGTGVGPRDVTPEAVADLLDRRLPGVEAQFLHYARERHPYAMLSRVVAGMRRDTVIVALPGSPGACQDGLDALFPYLKHALSVREGAHHGRG